MRSARRGLVYTRRQCASANEVLARYDVLSGLSGLRMNPFSSRYYYGSGVSAHITGYAQPIPAEEVETYQRSGYRINERVGMQGLEKWGDSYLWVRAAPRCM
jgi:cell division protein FtsI/penicillin-binding protein 2